MPLSVAVEAAVYVVAHSRGSHPLARKSQDAQTSVGTQVATCSAARAPALARRAPRASSTEQCVGWLPRTWRTSTFTAIGRRIPTQRGALCITGVPSTSTQNLPEPRKPTRSHCASQVRRLGSARRLYHTQRTHRRGTRTVLCEQSLKQTLLQLAQSRSDECAACMLRAGLLPTCAILVCGANKTRFVSPCTLRTCAYECEWMCPYAVRLCSCLCSHDASAHSAADQLG